MRWPAWAALDGPSLEVQNPPDACTACGGKDFYQQPDFKRSIGLTIVTCAAVATLLLEVAARSWMFDWSPVSRWTVVWSPFVIALIFDRLLVARLTPFALVCYKCGTNYRGIPKAKLEDFEGFDLETHDRHRYAEEHQNSQ